MPTTTYPTVTGFKAYALQARTDSAGSPVDDVDGEDLRALIEALFTEGIVSPTTGFQVVENSGGADMSVDVGSGTAKTDLAVVDGTASGQGRYLVRLEDSVVDVTVPAADLSNPRVDEVYLVVQDNAYDSSGNVLPRLAYREGDPASSPVDPGPDASWDAFYLLATIDVAAAATEITDSDIQDEREMATLEPPLPGVWEVSASDGYPQNTTWATGQSAVTLDSVDLEIPSDWNEYRLEVDWSAVAGGGIPQQFQAKLEVNGTQIYGTFMVFAPSLSDYPFGMMNSLHHVEEGLTTTGTITVRVRADAESSYFMDAGPLFIRARAVRTA